MELPEGWAPVPVGDAPPLEAELRRELPASHRLRGHSVRAIARHLYEDDVLFLSLQDGRSVFCVHLTWSVERDPQWPWTTDYADLQDFAVRWPKEERGDD